MAGIIIVFACLAAVAGTRLSRHVGSAVSADPAKTEGPENAPVTIVVFSDFQCPYCSRFAPILKKVHEEFPNDVKIIFKHFPLKMHPLAIPAAEAAECAGDQGKFWAYHDMLFEKNDAWGELEPKNVAPALKGFAKDLGLDTARFNACLDKGEKKQLISANKLEGKKFMVSGTPTAVLNFKKYIVSLDEEGIRKTIQEELKKANKK